jgi:hypothetical protein
MGFELDSLYLTNIPWEGCEAELSDYFSSQCGEVRRCPNRRRVRQPAELHGGLLAVKPGGGQSGPEYYCEPTG